MVESFNTVLNYYKHQFSETLENPEAQKEFNYEMNNALKVLENSKSNLSGFFTAISGENKHANMGALNFPQRFIKGDLNTEKIKLLNSIISESFMVGYIYHFIFLRFPTRDQTQLVDFHRLYTNWSVKSLVADMILKGYNQDQNKAPEKYFKLYFEDKKNYDKVLTAKFKFGRFQKSKVYSFMRNIMFSGSLYGMSYDMATKGHYDNN